MTQFSAAAHAVQFDHLVVLAPTLEAGAQHVSEALGVEPVAGGSHAQMGTHNQLLNLGRQQYLEILAPDPRATTPARPRWFGLDRPEVRERLAQRPFLAHWVARVHRPKDLARWHSQYPQRIAPVLPMTRGEFHWNISVPADGSLPGDGLLPTLIQWQTPLHPSERLPAAQVSLRALCGFHAQARQLQDELAWLGADHLIEFDETLEPASLMAIFDTPDGQRVLR
jgi:hypothetical protein